MNANPFHTIPQVFVDYFDYMQFFLWYKHIFIHMHVFIKPWRVGDHIKKLSEANSLQNLLGKKNL